MSFEETRESLDTPTTNNLASPINEHEVSPTKPQPQPPTVDAPVDGETRERIQHVLQSDIGIQTLLNRLKQSISSARDFANFLKERSQIEEKHAQNLKRLSRGTHEIVRRPESKGGSFATNFEEITKIHDRMSDNGLQFSNNLFQMNDELQELTSRCERDRKHWKQVGLDAERKVQDAESTMNKAKGKYNTLAESYDRARTGERQSGKFGIKGTKSAAQQEEDLHRKLEAADGDYATKVQAAQTARQDLLRTHRPQAVRALEAAIQECDAGLGMQLSKYAALNERLLLGNGLCVSPLKSPGGAGAKSLRDAAQGVDNQKDFHDYVLSFQAKAGQPHPDIKYEKHPALSPKQQQVNQPPPQSQSFVSSQPQMGTPERNNTGFNQYQPTRQPTETGQISGVMPYQPTGGAHNRMASGPQNSFGPQNSYGQQSNQTPISPANQQAPQLPQIGVSGPGPDPMDEFRSPVKTPTEGRGPMHSSIDTRPSDNAIPGTGGFPRPPTQEGPSNQVHSPTAVAGFAPDGRPVAGQPGSHPSSRGPSLGQSGDFGGQARNPAYNNIAFQPRPPTPTGGGYRGVSGATGQASGPPTMSGAMALPSVQRNAARPQLPPLQPVFGMSLDELFRRDQTAVPLIVLQCVKAVDIYGQNTEGIYRTSGSAPVIHELKALFDHNSSQVDLANPEVFHHDIASVTTLLKHFLRDLPDPVFTSAAYQHIMRVAQIPDDSARRDALHAIINDLPDPNYATLRVLMLHLNRIAQNSERNRMTPSNIGICLGPTLLSKGGNATANGDMKDAGWQAKVIETLVNNTLDIFDDDVNEEEA